MMWHVWAAVEMRRSIRGQALLPSLDCVQDSPLCIATTYFGHQGIKRPACFSTVHCWIWGAACGVRILSTITCEAKAGSWALGFMKSRHWWCVKCRAACGSMSRSQTRKTDWLERRPTWISHQRYETYGGMDLSVSVFCTVSICIFGSRHVEWVSRCSWLERLSSHLHGSHQVVQSLE